MQQDATQCTGCFQYNWKIDCNGGDLDTVYGEDIIPPPGH